MDYKKAYDELLSTVMDDSDNLSLGALRKVKQVNNSLADAVTAESEDDSEYGSTDLVTAKEWNDMSFQDRVDLKQNHPDAYQNSLQGNFKEGN